MSRELPTDHPEARPAVLAYSPGSSFSDLPRREASPRPGRHLVEIPLIPASTATIVVFEQPSAAFEVGGDPVKRGLTSSRAGHRASTAALHVAWAIALTWASAGCLPASIGADLIVGSYRTHDGLTTPLPHRELKFTSDGIKLVGWLFPAPADPIGTIVYLHGRGSNRRGGRQFARHFGPMGYQVLAYDSRVTGNRAATSVPMGPMRSATCRGRSTPLEPTASSSWASPWVPPSPSRQLPATRGSAPGCGCLLHRPPDGHRRPGRHVHPVDGIHAAIRHAELRGHFNVDGVSPLRSRPEHPRAGAPAARQPR